MIRPSPGIRSSDMYGCSSWQCGHSNVPAFSPEGKVLVLLARAPPEIGADSVLVDSVSEPLGATSRGSTAKRCRQVLHSTNQTNGIGVLTNKRIVPVGATSLF